MHSIECALLVVHLHCVYFVATYIQLMKVVIRQSLHKGTINIMCLFVLLYVPDTDSFFCQNSLVGLAALYTVLHCFSLCCLFLNMFCAANISFLYILTLQTRCIQLLYSIPNCHKFSLSRVINLPPRCQNH